ncbi:MAG: ABC transporter ATP-binding protein [Treponema sp.]|jgi:branched-chain amino acid transport system ATP-binding protein|nr:ABC transporter ATP-binding protein [Treponema sp.]
MLSVRDLKVHYGAIQALQGISFDVREGEIVSLIGSNGAGKTTTLHAISNILSITGGTILFQGENISKKHPDAIVKDGLVQVPEGRRVFANLTVKENLEMGAFTRKDTKEVKKDMERIFSLFPRLKERARQVSGTLSGGEQQMLAMGRALMSKPRLLLLDEPSMGLAPILVEEIFSIIMEINKTGTTILLVEQNAYKALAIAHTAYVLETGTIVKQGKAKELIADEDVKKAYLGT